MIRAILLSLFALPALAAPTVLSNTDHATYNVTPNVLSNLSISGVTIDQTCPTGGTGYGGNACGSNGSFLPFSSFVTLAANAGTTYAIGTSTTRNSQPYTLLTQSSTGYTLAGIDQAFYSTLTTSGTLYNIAFCGTAYATDYPPVAASTVLPSNGGGCAYGAGIEFSIAYGASGYYTDSPSNTTASVAAIFAAMASNHPTWTWGDIKGALRQTASNWSSGYAPCTLNGAASCTAGTTNSYGYGNVNYTNATAIGSTASIYLEPPGFTVQNGRYYAIFTLYPFKTTRRVSEAVYVGGTGWPAANTVNELTAAQITATGATKITTCNTANGIVTCAYMAPANSTGTTFTALTLDASGNGSRVESFSQTTQAFTVSNMCVN